MSDDRPHDSESTETDEAQQGPPPTPFDHPLFLPTLLLAGVLWFGYDGWINTDPEMMEHQTFNQVGFAALVVLFGWFGYKGYNEWQEDKAKAAEDSASGAPPPPIA
jgi:hypothetical protein